MFWQQDHRLSENPASAKFSGSLAQLAFGNINALGLERGNDLFRRLTIGKSTGKRYHPHPSI